MIHYLYKIINNINYKIYYGIHSTYNISDNYMGSGSVLKLAFNKYGINNFSKEILYFANSIEELNKLEEEVVTEYFISRDYNYNQVIGGKSKIGYNHTDKAKEKISNALKGRIPTKEHINKIVNIRKLKNNYSHTKETKQKIKDNLPIRLGKDAPMYGKKHTKESKIKISNSKTGFKHSEKYKKILSEKKIGIKLTNSHSLAIKLGKQKYQGQSVIQYDMNDNFIKLWVAISDVARELNLHRNRIRMCCNNKAKSTGGFKFKFKNC